MQKAAIITGRNQNKHPQRIVLVKTYVEEQRLQHQFTLAFNLYNELAQQLENARIRIQQETPVIKLLEPVMVPIERSQPKRVRLMVIYTFIGGVLGVGYVFGRKEYLKLANKLKAA